MRNAIEQTCLAAALLFALVSPSMLYGQGRTAGTHQADKFVADRFCTNPECTGPELARGKYCFVPVETSADLTDALDFTFEVFDDDHGVVIDLATAKVTVCADGTCDTETVTVNWERDDGSPADVLTSDLVGDADGQTSCASGCDVNTISGTENDFQLTHALKFKVVSISAGVRSFRTCVYGKKDDGE